jgi:hypothetical protein
MKMLLSILGIAVVVFLMVSVFIPTERIQSLSVQTTVQNAVAALGHPTGWRSLDSGKNTRISEVSYMLYQIAEPGSHGDTTAFTLAILPDVSPQHDPNKISLSYAYPSTVFYKFFPRFEKPTKESRIVGELQHYLQDNTLFYGYPITTERLVDSFFLATQKDIAARDLLKTLPGMIKELEDYARSNSCRVIAQNISVAPLGHDSITLMAGLNIDRSIPGDNVHTFRELPSTLGLVAGEYEGAFRDRIRLYTAMEKFITDHALAKHGLPYERYLTSLPTSDSSYIKIRLLFPVSYR